MSDARKEHEVIGDIIVELIGQALAPDVSSWSQERRRRVGLVLTVVLLVLAVGTGIAVALLWN